MMDSISFSLFLLGTSGGKAGLKPVHFKLLSMSLVRRNSQNLCSSGGAVRVPPKLARGPNQGL